MQVVSLCELPRELNCVIISMLTLRPISNKPDVRSIGRLASTCKYFRVLININDAASSLVRDPREKERRIRCMKLREENLLVEWAPHVFISSCDNYWWYITYESYLMISGPPCLCFITRSPNITIGMLLDLINIKPCHHYTKEYTLCQYSNITIDELRLNNLRIDVNNSLSLFTFRDIQARDLNMYKFMSCANIRFADIENNPTFPWKYEELIRNPRIPARELFSLRMKWGIKGLTADELRRYCADRENQLEYERHLVSEYATAEVYARYICDRYFDLRTIAAHPDIPWDWVCISRRIDAPSMKFMRDNPDMPWNYNSIELVARTPDHDKNVEYHKMYQDGTLTIKDIQDVNDAASWDWCLLAAYKYISVSDILKHMPNQNDYVYVLSTRDDVTAQITREYPLSWRYGTILDKLPRP